MLPSTRFIREHDAELMTDGSNGVVDDGEARQLGYAGAAADQRLLDRCANYTQLILGHLFAMAISISALAISCSASDDVV